MSIVIPTRRRQRLGGEEKIEEDESIKQAAELAASCDVAVVVCGLTPEWESEGFDRPDLSLPRRQNELISSVGRANPNTVVVIQAVRELAKLSPMSYDIILGIGHRHATLG